MTNEITKRDSLPSLPVATKVLMQGWRVSPRKSYDSLPETISHEEIIRSDSPCLAQIKNHISPDTAKMIVAMAIEDVNRLFRADRRMEPQDIAVTAKAILRRFWYLKPEDIKKCFNGRRPKQFVLEGDSFISWLSEYDLRRDNTCEDMAVNGKPDEPNSGAITHKTYLAMLKARADSGDKEAARSIAEYQRRGRSDSLQDKERKRQEFIKYKIEYLKKKYHDKTCDEPQDEAYDGPQHH